MANAWLQRPAQQVIFQFTRRQLEAGQLDTVPMTIVQRVGATSW